MVIAGAIHRASLFGLAMLALAGLGERKPNVPVEPDPDRRSHHAGRASRRNQSHHRRRPYGK